MSREDPTPQNSEEEWSWWRRHSAQGAKRARAELTDWILRMVDGTYVPLPTNKPRAKGGCKPGPKRPKSPPTGA